MTVLAIDLPWPSRDLHPNARVHWAAKAKAAKRARGEAAIAARAAGVKVVTADALRVTATFSPPDKRLRDADGLLSSLKSALDGIADVVGIDDHRWDIAIRRASPVKGGNVRIEIEVI